MPTTEYRRVLATYAQQRAATAERVRALTPEQLAAPSALPGWTVRTLVGHMVLIHEGTAMFLDVTAEAAASAAEFARGYGRDTELTDKLSQEFGTRPSAELADRLEAPFADPELADQTAIAGPTGPITVLTWMTTRLLDLVVHSDDLSRSLPDLEPVPLERSALATSVRTLAEILAAQAPGRSVEVRVPPFVAVQAVPGPRHTRGTPPNVVETDGLTWLRVATGRTRFADAAATGDIRATGPRSDLSEYLPVLQ